MTKDDIVKEAVNSTPPASVAGLTLAGVQLNDWVMVATLLYLILQISWFIYSKQKGLKDGSD
jgi:hypothetical protein